jgi:hypothetical protein
MHIARIDLPNLATELYEGYNPVQLPIAMTVMDDPHFYEGHMLHLMGIPFGRNFPSRLASWTAQLEYQGLVLFAIGEGFDPATGEFVLASDEVFSIRTESDYSEAAAFFADPSNHCYWDTEECEVMFVVAPRALLNLPHTPDTSQRALTAG